MAYFKKKGIMKGETWDDLRVNPATLPDLGANNPTHEIVVNDGNVSSGSAFEFNGTTSKGTVPYYFDMNTDTLSIAMWIKPNDITSAELFDRDATGDFELWIDNGNLTFNVNGKDVVASGIIAGATQFIVVTATPEGTRLRIKLYIDGTLITNQRLFNTSLEQSTTAGYIFGEWTDGGYNYDGVIDNIQTYNISLTDAQITEMYNNGEGLESVPTGVVEATDLIAYFKDSTTNIATLGSTYDMVTTDVTITDGLIGGTNGSFGVAALAFPPGVKTETFFTGQMPHKYKLGTDLHPHLHVFNNVSGSTGNVVWGFEYVWVDYGKVFGNTTITSNTIAVDDYRKHVVNNLTPWSGNNIEGVSSVMMCRLFRDGANVDDTYNEKIYLVEFDWHFQIDSDGSRSEFIK